MKILYIGTLTQGSVDKLIFDALQKKHSEVTAFKFTSGDWMAERDTQLIKEAKSHDLILCTSAYMFSLDAFKSINKSTPIVLLFTGADNVHYLNAFSDKVPAMTAAIMTQFNTYVNLSEVRDDVYFIPIGVDIDSFNVFGKKSELFDIAFNGKTDTEEILRYHSYRPFNTIPDTGSNFQMKHIRGTKINLDFNTESSGPSQRMFRILASGGFLLMQEFVGMKLLKFKKGIHYDTFNSKEEYLEKIEYYLTHDEEREKIASKGRHDLIKFDYTTSFFVDELLRILKDYA